jgi:hypothetical protein
VLATFAAFYCFQSNYAISRCFDIIKSAVVIDKSTDKSDRRSLISNILPQINDSGASLNRNLVFKRFSLSKLSTFRLLPRISMS